ncbi:MAG: AAA family ATPase, partial [Gemmatimonadaceae bacterium]
MPLFYRSPDEFVAAAEAVTTTAAPRRPVAILACEIDPGQPSSISRATPESRLGAVADIVRHTLRTDDHVGRIGTRLVLVLPGATSEDGRSVGERICAAVRTHTMADGQGAMTVSVGVAGGPEHGNAYEIVLAAATVALTRVQAQGRDGAMAAPLPHHEALRRPLSIERLAGRGQELTSLVRWLDEVCEGQPRIVSVFGETGTGTGTLLRQLESEVRIRGGLFVHSASTHVDIPPPFGVWSGLLRATHRFANAPNREWNELQHLEPLLGEPRETPTTTGSQYRLLSELAEYFRALASDRPIVLILDDMQWADATSWDALEHLVGQLSNERIMICLAHRAELAYESAAQREMLQRSPLFRELTISRLTRDEVKRWLDAAFHQQQVGREFLAFLYRHTEGNPLFIAQLLRALVEEGSIWHNGSRWEWSPVSELRLPAGYRALIAGRLSKFSSSTQAVLGTAAIIGRQFDIGLLAASGAGSEAAVRLAVSEGVVAGLLRPTYERRQGGYSFVHDAIAEVLVEGIPRDRVRQLHSRVARAIEVRKSDRIGAVALHYDAAGEVTDAYRCGQLAAFEADRVYGHAAAVAFLQLAARNSTGPAELAEIRVALARAAETGGRHDEVEELCDLAIEWFEGQGDSRRTLTLRYMREHARIEQDQPARATLDALVALDAEAQRIGFDIERVAILTLASRAHGRLGETRLAERLAAESVEMAERIGDQALLANALTRLGNTLLAESPARAEVEHARALELYERIGDIRGQARAHINMG